MKTLLELQQEAARLGASTETGSISPSDVFGQHEEFIQHLADMAQRTTFDNELGILKLRVGETTYAVAGEAITAPAAPTCADASDRATTSDYVDITLTCATSGATIHYTLDGSDPRTSATAQTGTTVRLSGILAQQETEFEVRAASRHNGLWSEQLFFGSFTFRRQVATPSITADGNDYATQRTVTITCATSGATIRYTIDGTAPSASSPAYNPADKPKLTATATVRAIATLDGWEPSANAQQKTYTVAAKKAYYGFSTSSTLANAAAVTALASTGGSQERAKLQGALTITPTGDTAGYVWLCCTGTLTPNTIVPNQGDVIPFGFESAITVDGWNCYRSTEAINPVSTNVYIP